MNQSEHAEAAVGFLCYEDKFMLLRRQGHQSSAGEWGLVGGKVEQGETNEEAFKREVSEEVGIHIATEKAECLGIFDLINPSRVWRVAVYKTILQEFPEISHAEATTADTIWLTKDACTARDDIMKALRQLLEEHHVI